MGARADSRGLHYQTLDYARHLPVQRVYGIDMTQDDLSPYPVEWGHYESLPIDLTVNRYSQLDEQEIRQWLRGLDVVIGAETYYADEFPVWAAEEGVKTVMMSNREFTPWFQGAERWHRHGLPPKPDVLAMPTTWMMDTIDHPHVVHLPMGVDRLAFPFNVRTKANRFVHVAGHKAASDRAGTRIVFAMLGRNPGLDIVIRSQSETGFSVPRGKGTVEVGNVGDRRELIHDADVVLLPRRYGGNSLIHQEALSSGIPVISLDREPENQWGGVITVPSRARQKLRTKGGLIPINDAHPSHLLQAMTTLANDPAKVEELSYAANEHARTIDWDRLEGVYVDLFNSLL